ncbi:hypothetical protein ACO0LG_27595 [Undibacterium sp. Ji42W]|uniref:hypothetical protein n=1 Tax=Undibacterium sp. Ji42W TaxID=3413039 RepID=UPI003BF1116A
MVFEGNGIQTRTSFIQAFSSSFHIVITDGWPAAYENAEWSLTIAHLEQMGNPKFLPTPAFSIGKEIDLNPVSYAGFTGSRLPATGYPQKNLLLPVQKAILGYLPSYKKPQ